MSGPRMLPPDMPTDRLFDSVHYRDFLEAALACSTEEAFRESSWFRAHGAALLEFLSTPWIIPHETPRSSSGDSLRVVHWNIEKGLQLDRIVARLCEDPELRDADLYTFNEVDVGMARSGENADVGAVLASALGCHRVYLPSYVECTKGPGPDADAPGWNRRGLHGLAVLSRYPIRRAGAVELPACFDYFGFFEKRFGYRQGLLVEIDWHGQPVRVSTTHLEVRNVPACRARQLRALLDGLARFEAEDNRPSILTGDFNTNSFRRGGLANSAREFSRIVSTPPDRLAAELVAPYEREPLFSLLERSGFDYRSHTDGAPTASQVLGSAEDLAALPDFLARWLTQRFGLGSRVLRMRLDWIATRGFHPAGPPRTDSPETASGPASDHGIVRADLRIGS